MGEMSSYTVPASQGSSEYVEKRSRFLGRVGCADSEEAARDFIAKVKKEHHDARHNCWCYIIKDGPERYSDDGEPQGTAGIPMLEIMKREGVTNVVCVVTRYFGGVLLGAGGLFRAYSKAAKEALDSAGRKEIVPRVWFTIPCPYNLADRVKQEFPSFSGTIEETEYAENTVFIVSVPEANAEGFPERIFDITNGSVKAEKHK